MIRRTLAASAAALAFAAPAQAAPLHGAHSTSYCLLGTMADGSYTRSRSVAVLPGTHPLGTKIRVEAVYRNGRYVSDRIRGLKHFVVRDHIGHGSELDFWSPSCHWSLNSFGRAYVKYRVR